MSTPYDLIGPVLPQALRLARYQALASLPKKFSDVQTENDTINQTPSREEKRLLVSNAGIMAALEDLFSWREKDRTCRTSKLSRLESIRFQRAMYRIWLMSVLFGPRRFVPRGACIEEDYEAREADFEQNWQDQKTFLLQFSSQELFQIRKLAWFLIFTAGWAVTAEGHELGGTMETYDWRGMYLFAGPHTVLRCFEDGTTAYLPKEYILEDGTYTKFITHALSEIIRERQVTEPIGYIGIILDDIYGAQDRCHQCGSAGMRGTFAKEVRFLPDLYNKTNWDDLKGQLEHQFLVARNLSYNLLEKPLVQALDGDWPTLIQEMFGCKCDEYEKWVEEDWTCANCWTSFFFDTLWRWRLAQKEKTGKPIGENCRYGYDCRQQCSERGLAHAKQFNHLCIPQAVEQASARGI